MKSNVGPKNENQKIKNINTIKMLPKMKTLFLRTQHFF